MLFLRRRVGCFDEQRMKNKPLVVFEDPLALVGDRHRFGFEDFLQATAVEPEAIRVRGQQVCRFFTKGFCVQGSQCPFRHGELKPFAFFLSLLFLSFSFYVFRLGDEAPQPLHVPFSSISPPFPVIPSLSFFSLCLFC